MDTINISDYHKISYSNINDIKLKLKNMLIYFNLLTEFIEDFKGDLYNEEVFVFTPKGDLITLPVNSTVLDFAFAIHSEIGKKTRGTRVNGKLVPLSKILSSGDQIEILTSKNTSPKSGWIDFVKTSRARSIIKSSLKEQKNNITIEGEQILKRKLKHIKVNFNEKALKSMVFTMLKNHIKQAKISAKRQTTL